MALFAGSLKEFLTIKVKVRNDDYSDQMSRLVVTKMFVVCTLLTALDWFHDTVNCLPPAVRRDQIEIPLEYLQSACWISGVFIYPELADHMEKSSYYGIPILLQENGLRTAPGHHSPELCRTTGHFGENNQNICKPMEKLFFTQYQWMPYFVATVGVLFYIPYIMFRIINTDMVSLRNALRRDKIEIEDIVNNFFSYDINSPFKMRCRVILNVFNKFLYFLINYGSFLGIDSVMNQHFMTYGMDWAAWAAQNTARMDFLSRKKPSPGNEMLPTFGMCTVVDTRQDSVTSYANKYTVVCELSSHLLYQYMFVILWFVLVFSMAVSILGIVLHLCGHVYILLIVKRKKLMLPIAGELHHREIEYLEFVRRRDLTTYGKVLRRLQTFKLAGRNHVNGGLEMEYKELTVSESVT